MKITIDGKEYEGLETMGNGVRPGVDSIKLDGKLYILTPINPKHTELTQEFEEWAKYKHCIIRDEDNNEIVTTLYASDVYPDIEEKVSSLISRALDV